MEEPERLFAFDIDVYSAPPTQQRLLVLLLVFLAHDASASQSVLIPVVIFCSFSSFLFFLQFPRHAFLLTPGCSTLLSIVARSCRSWVHVDPSGIQPRYQFRTTALVSPPTTPTNFTASCPMFPLFSPPPLDSPLRSSPHALGLSLSFRSLFSPLPVPDDRPNASRKASAPFFEPASPLPGACRYPLALVCFEAPPVACIFVPPPHCGYGLLVSCSRPAGYGLLRVRVPATACMGWSGMAWQTAGDSSTNNRYVLAAAAGRVQRCFRTVCATCAVLCCLPARPTKRGIWCGSPKLMPPSSISKKQRQQQQQRNIGTAMHPSSVVAKLMLAAVPETQQTMAKLATKKRHSLVLSCWSLAPTFARQCRNAVVGSDWLHPTSWLTVHFMQAVVLCQTCLPSCAKATLVRWPLTKRR